MRPVVAGPVVGGQQCADSGRQPVAGVCGPASAARRRRPAAGRRRRSAVGRKVGRTAGLCLSRAQWARSVTVAGWRRASAEFRPNFGEQIMFPSGKPRRPMPRDSCSRQPCSRRSCCGSRCPCAARRSRRGSRREGLRCRRPCTPHRWQRRQVHPTIAEQLLDTRLGHLPPASEGSDQEDALHHVAEAAVIRRSRGRSLRVGLF